MNSIGMEGLGVYLKLLLWMFLGLLEVFKQVQGYHLTCHDCSGDKSCKDLIERNLGGDCTTKAGLPKCFIRQDPNKRVYRGCADNAIWPKDLHSDYNGCMYQPYSTWNKQAGYWCFCDTDFCNVNILLQRYMHVQQRNITVHMKAVQHKVAPKKEVTVVKHKAPPMKMTRVIYHHHHHQKQPVRQYRYPRVEAKKQVSFYNPFGINYVEPLNRGSYSRKQPPKMSTQLRDPPRKAVPPKINPPIQISYLRPAYNVKPMVVSRPRPEPRRNNPPSYMEIRPLPRGNTNRMPGGENNRPSGRDYNYPSRPNEYPRASNNRHNNYPSGGNNYPNRGNNYPNGGNNYPSGDNNYPSIPNYMPSGSNNVPNGNSNKRPNMRPPQGDNSGYRPNPPKKQRPWYDDGFGNRPFTPPPARPSRRPSFTNPPRREVSVIRFTPAPQTNPPTYTLSDLDNGVEGKQGPKSNNINLNDLPPYNEGTTRPKWEWGKHQEKPRRVDIKDPKFTDDISPSENDIIDKPLKPEKDRHTCQKLDCEHSCEIHDDHPHCTCPTGYELNKDSRTCSDIDECQVRNGDCSHDCKNTPGSFICLCSGGYTLDVNRRTCVDYNECRYLKGLECQHGCRNVAGTYRCTCRHGYVLNSDGKTCDDVDECIEGTHECSDTCINTVGSYNCECNHGGQLDTNLRTCRDLNECLVNNGGCAQRCRNTQGSYICYCDQGYELNVDGKTCDDLNECLRDNGGCDHICTNTLGSYQCSCRTGYQLDTDMHTCIDVNECLTNNGGCNHVCDNVEGSYRCVCHAGNKLNVDSRTCDPINQCLENNGGCEHICTSTATGSRCSCRPGFMLRPDGLTCADINECSTRNGGCDHECINLVGSFSCACRQGFELNVDNSTCDDINECQYNNGNCEQLCENVPGAYQCGCNKGWSLAPGGRQCQDVNECLIDNGGCEQICNNTIGSYFCSCRGPIYVLHTNGRDCHATCPATFIKNDRLSSCYKVFTPTTTDEDTDEYSKNIEDATKYCKSLHPLGGLLSVQTTQEKIFVSGLLKREKSFLDQWQGWWTSGFYHTGLNTFQWADGKGIENESPHWGFKKTPFPDTCVWVLQISAYNQTWGNYECLTKSGFICEVELPDK